METRFSDKFNLFSKENIGSVRTVLADNGEIWFVGMDICKILGIKNPSQAYTRLDTEEKANLISNEVGGNNKKNSHPVQLVIVSESGMYGLIMGSRKAEAREFQKWVTGEVLPSIRKNGGYILGQEELKNEDRIRIEATIQELSTRVTKLQKRRHEILEENRKLKAAEKHAKKELSARNELLDTYERMIDRYYSDYIELLKKNKALMKAVEELKNPVLTKKNKPIEFPKYYYDIFGNRYNTIEDARIDRDR